MGDVPTHRDEAAMDGAPERWWRQRLPCLKVETWGTRHVGLEQPGAYQWGMGEAG